MAIPLSEKIQTLGKLLREPKILRALLSFRHSGYLVEVGWFNAFRSSVPLDEKNEPIPWLTYSFLDFFLPRLRKGFRIFEFGCGASTLYYSPRVKEVISVEHNLKWHRTIARHRLPNNRLLHVPLDSNGEYCRSIYLPKKKFDIIVVDGEDRVNCLRQSTAALKRNGVVVLDDSERTEYAPGIQHMARNKFKRLDFWGFSPGLFYKKATSIFYKRENCLNI